MLKEKIEYIKIFIPMGVGFQKIRTYRIGENVEYGQDEYYKVEDIDKRYVILFNKYKGIKKIEYPKSSEIHYYGEKQEKRKGVFKILFIISFFSFNPVVIIPSALLFYFLSENCEKEKIKELEEAKASKKWEKLKRKIMTDDTPTKLDKKQAQSNLDEIKLEDIPF